jgi:tetrahydromethanopterin S-methyltransferase subunit G
MIGAMYNKLQELQFELYVAKQIKDEDKYREIQKQIENLEQQIKTIQGDE